MTGVAARLPTSSQESHPARLSIVNETVIGSPLAEFRVPQAALADHRDLNDNGEQNLLPSPFETDCDIFRWDRFTKNETRSQRIRRLCQ